MLFKHFGSEKITTLTMFVDDINVTGDNLEEMGRGKEKLEKRFEIKDLERLKYFLRIEVSRSNEGIVISHISSEKLNC